MGVTLRCKKTGQGNDFCCGGWRVVKSVFDQVHNPKSIRVHFTDDEVLFECKCGTEWVAFDEEV